MQDPNLSVISAFKFEKRIQIFVAVYLSIILLSIVLILVRIDMTTELQQALVIVLGLISIATLDAFKKALDSKPFPWASVGNQIIIREGGVYVGGDYVGGSINHAIESKQTLAEAAVEIHKLLQELEKFNPTATEAEKVAYVNEEVTPAFKSRVASAVKVTGETEASIEIQQLLQQLEESDSALEESKTKVAPNFKSRLANALRAGGEVAMESLLDNPYSTITLAIVKAWMSPEEAEQPTQHNNPSATD
ncbi:hypothetical protein B9G53_16415 [Pseudanabaena sp. SR411]|uniref:hypothetical protein n=1 Tax=Pseudanabaena sp. SR411 TaxID=1980935 RepID=UPI000B990D95|nr:hypothetical protein [Pseudanabaena sp. SR411]OYQ63559.1 hypothetical protein B9G53_16415 [Pseudanabaena sp. SR411]